MSTRSWHGAHRASYCAATQEANGGKVTAVTDEGRGIVAGLAMSVRGGA